MRQFVLCAKLLSSTTLGRITPFTSCNTRQSYVTTSAHPVVELHNPHLLTSGITTSFDKYLPVGKVTCPCVDKLAAKVEIWVPLCAVLLCCFLSMVRLHASLINTASSVLVIRCCRTDVGWPLINLHWEWGKKILLILNNCLNSITAAQYSLTLLL